MKSLATTCFSLIASLLFSLPVLGQIDAKDLIGAWQMESNEPGEIVAIVADGYYAVTIYDLEKKSFVTTFGGSWQLDGSNFKRTLEFHSSEPSEVGRQEGALISLTNDKVVFTESGDTWARIDAGKPGALSGAWLFSGRERNGEMTTRTPGPRKTMKILSGTRFQWIAYNTETAAFSGTGGGTYTTENGKYIENLEFFSRDSTRVGAELQFDFELKESDWHHKGKSSKGQPIYEVWSLR